MSEPRIPLAKRPLSPRLTVYRWHPGMVASLAHRVSGLVLVLFVPFYLWQLRGMTGSPEGFADSLALLHAPQGRVALWVAGVSFAYHFANGIRFLLLDAGVGEGRGTMRRSAQFVLGVALLTALALGVALW